MSLLQINFAIEETRKILGKRWSHRARGPMAYDCIGFVGYYLNACNIKYTDRIDYSDEPWQSDNLQIECRKQFGDPVPELKIGNLAIFKWPRAKYPSHIAVIGCNNKGTLTLLHSHNHNNFLCVEHDFSGFWIDKLFLESYNPWPK